MINGRKILTPQYRGSLLDIVIFFVNIISMWILSTLFMNLARSVGNDSVAKLIIGLFFAGLFFLQPAGAILKRWHTHQRGKLVDFNKNERAGCFLPWLMIFYFVLMIMIFAAAVVLLSEVILGEQSGSNVPVLIILGGIVLCIINTIFVYRYFSPPRKPPRLKFLITPQSEIIGDICIFLNMICFQIFWSLFASIPFGRPHDVGEILGRIFLLGFVSMLIYFPPRIFYLAEDFNRKSTWLTMLLANSPFILRIVFGAGSAASW